MSKLADVLFKGYRKRVLSLLLMHPEKQYHVREIARLTNTVAGTLHKELSRLEEASILKKQTIGNQVFYAANTACPIYEELAAILRKTVGLVDVLTDALIPLKGKIDTAMVFGSIASGKESAGSDVDLLVIGSVKFADVVRVIHSSQDVLQREINPKVYSKKEWKSLLNKNDTFAVDVNKNPKLFIIGGMDEHGQLGGNFS